MRILLFFLMVLIGSSLKGQDISATLAKAMDELEQQPSMQHASIALYVIDNKSGKTVYAKNAQLGMAPASTQKIFTSATTFELLGKTFRYQTDFILKGKITHNKFEGRVQIRPSGDPSLGSWRWQETSAENLVKQLADAIKSKGIQYLDGPIEIVKDHWDTQATPDGWTWEDIGNYFGAGARALNWNENSYKLHLKPGKNIGDPVGIISTEPSLTGIDWINEIKTARAGTGDNAVIYLPENGRVGYLKGTIPAGVDRFTIRGSLPAVDTVFLHALKVGLKKNKIEWNPIPVSPGSDNTTEGVLKDSIVLLSYRSPGFDSLNYWFMRESINLYGEAFLKTIGYRLQSKGETTAGINLVKDYWKARGIETAALQIQDGSGLSPSNRVTAHALVTVLTYARKQDWFSSFYQALPLQHNIKMKSGYIGGVRSYAGYIDSKSGVSYSFAFIINSFDGSPGPVREKMWQILDLLK
jgi:D-alanyl-D-alanine carboxypeptidase/D-alanyl-D-alanine-endopeptidase (penicillin-binding protein 4)